MRADDIFDLEAMARINAELDDPIRVMREANAALPDTDPRKITRADVEAMDKPYNALQRYRLGAHVPDDEAREAQNVLLAVAAKLAALLQPE